MGVNHRRRHILVAEHLLNRPNIVSALDPVRGETVKGFRANGITLEAHHLPDLVHELEFGIGNHLTPSPVALASTSAVLTFETELT